MVRLGSLLSSTLRLIVTLGVVLALSFLVSGGLSVWLLRQQAIDEWSHHLQKLSLILVDHASHAISSSDVILKEVIDELRDAGIRTPAEFRRKVATRQFHRLIRGRAVAAPQVEVVTVAAENGDVIAQSRGYPAQPISIGDRDMFEAHRNSPAAGLYFGRPVRSRARGEWTFYISRRLSAPDGSFLGVVSVGILSQFVSGFYDRINLGGEATLNLFRSDGVRLARAPFIEGAIGAKVVGGTIGRSMEQGVFDRVVLYDLPRAVEGGKRVLRMAVLRRVGDYPLMVSAQFTERLFLAEWRRSTLYITASTALGVLAVVGAMSLLTSAVRRRDEAMRAARKIQHEAESASAAKSEFLSRMSHELRTPLNGILGFAQLLASTPEEPLTEQQRVAVESITKGGWHLLTLINEVLDLERIESGKLRISIEPVDLAAVIAEALELMRPLADQRGVRLVCESFAEPLPLVRGDHTRVRQVVLNLLSNAIKYNREGGSVRLAVAPTRDDRLRLSVEDTGLGMSAEQLEGLYQPFNRLGREFMGIEGAGIGLAITRRLMEQMGGAMDVNSEPNKGSTFALEFAVAERVPTADADSSAGREDSRAAPARSARKVIYVEDNPSNVALMRSILARRPQVELVVAHTGPLGLDLAQAHVPDLMIIDINLPGMNGLDLCRRIKSNPRTRDVPCIALTASAMPKDLQEGLEAGFEKYLTKPLNVAAFLKDLDSLLAVPDTPNAIA
jgi:signal transduction histidine kinase/ActR/RegA family two-component response regulator